MKILEKLTNIVMPIDEVMDEEEIEEFSGAESRKVANGLPVDMPSVEYSKPKLTVHTTPTADLSIKIYHPHEFGDVRRIADDLKEKKAVIINFDDLQESEQRRICDFANGVCYVMNGQAKRISNSMVLYVPNGVSVAAVSSNKKFYDK